MFHLTSLEKYFIIIMLDFFYRLMLHLDVFSLTFHLTFLNFSWIGSYSDFNLLKIVMNLDLLGMVSVMFQLFTVFIILFMGLSILPVIIIV